MLGLSLGDADRLTPAEFRHTAEAFEKHERGAWERARLIGMCALLPYSKKGLKAPDVMQFAWDDAVHDGATLEREPLSEEETMARYRAAMATYGF